jgi:hypothetical protein
MPPVVGAIGGAAAWYGTLGMVGQAVVQLAAGTALTAAQMAFRKTPDAPAMKARLALPDGLPGYRTVYGRYRVEGAPFYRVRGQRLWVGWILNSRPSVGGPVSIWIDKRKVTLSGDPFDFAGDGAIATNPVWVRDELPPEYLARFWIGLGAQTAPPAWILDAAPEFFLPTDRLQGRTVLWAEFRSGGERKRAKRWRNIPPRVHVEMDWSAVWDPRDAGQDPDEPESWGFSRNAALCTLDALRNNPVARYRLRHLHLPSWVDKADVDGELVALRDGGTQQRYPIGGVIDWSAGEVERLIEPMVLASLGGLTRVGGRLAAIPGAWQEPEVTLSRALKGQDLVIDGHQPGDQMYSAVRTTYIEPAQDWQEADAGVCEIPGAAAEDGGLPREKKVHLEFCNDGVQGQRIGQALARIGRRQRRISGLFPPEAIQAVPGANVTLAWPEPYAPLNRAYAVESMHPGLDVLGEQGLALRCPMVLRAAGPEDYDWNPATDQRDLAEGEDVPGFVPDLAMPGVITAVSGSAAALGSGGSATPRIRFAFDPAASERVGSYGWEYRLSGGTWADGGRINARVRDGSGKVFGYLHPVLVGEVYDIAVWSQADGDESEPRVYSGVVALAADVTLTPPAISAAPGAGQVVLTITTPNSDDVRGVQLLVSSTTNPLTAAVLPPDPVWSDANRTFQVAETGLTAGTVRHYWARTRGPYGALSELSARVSATAT